LFAVFTAIGQHMERERFGVKYCFFLRAAIGEHAGQIAHLGDRPAVDLLLAFDNIGHEIALRRSSIAEAEW